MTASQRNFKRKLIGFGALLAFFIFFVLSLSVYTLAAQTPEGSAIHETAEYGDEGIQTKSTDPEVVKFAFLAAAIVVGVGSIGAGAAVGYVGAAAMGAIGEKPELANRALLFVALAEGIAIYGLIIAIMILVKV